MTKILLLIIYSYVLSSSSSSSPIKKVLIPDISIFNESIKEGESREYKFAKLEEGLKVIYIYIYTMMTMLIVTCFINIINLF